MKAFVVLETDRDFLTANLANCQPFDPWGTMGTMENGLYRYDKWDMYVRVEWQGNALVMHYIAPGFTVKIKLAGEDLEGHKNPSGDSGNQVNHPSHYNDGNIEVIDYIEDKCLGFNLGNAVKYISRAGKKDPAKTLEDLQKAAWYLKREIEILTNKGGKS